MEIFFLKDDKSLYILNAFHFSVLLPTSLPRALFAGSRVDDSNPFNNLSAFVRMRGLILHPIAAIG
jgi:hypothetical protein